MDNRGKICRIINDRFSYRLVVDGKDITFNGSSSAEYFENHYLDLDYTVITEKVE